LISPWRYSIAMSFFMYLEPLGPLEARPRFLEVACIS
jgi:hypothetical protein